MKTKLGLLLLMLLIAVGCDDSTHLGETAEQPQPQSEPQPQPQPDPVPADLPVIELPSITNTLDMAFKEIPAGTFTMGSPGNEVGRQDGEHQHKVTISKAFYMQTTEVTQGQWKAVMGTEPWKGTPYVKEGPNYAAEYVSWDDAVAYCKTLSEKEGKTYRLPTEAEWEYACRAGTETAWSFGDDEKVLGDYAWYYLNANYIGEKYAHQVGLKKPNAFGLHDMHGNVFEWCYDYHGKDYYKESSEKDPTGPTSGSSRVLRGGSWDYFSRDSPSANRSSRYADHRSSSNGFRLVRELD
jgi:formylglycine-generating enzyme required for sulfatase activity